ncbi:MAG: hypothetical protein ACE5IR_21945 [bacterium]
MKEIIKKVLTLSLLISFWVHFCLPFDISQFFDLTHNSSHAHPKSSEIYLQTESFPSCLSLADLELDAQHVQHGTCTHEKKSPCCHSRLARPAFTSLPGFVSGCSCGHSNDVGAHHQRLALPAFFANPIETLSDATFSAGVAELQASNYYPTIYHPPCVFS